MSRPTMAKRRKIMVEERVQELEDKVEKLLAWAKAKATKIDELEEEILTLKAPKHNLTKSNLWSKEETDYLLQRLTGCEVPRPVLVSLAEKWEEKFSKPRSYDSLRKKWARLNK